MNFFFFLFFSPPSRFFYGSFLTSFPFLPIGRKVRFQTPFFPPSPYLGFPPVARRSACLWLKSRQFPPLFPLPHRSLPLGDRKKKVLIDFSLFSSGAFFFSFTIYWPLRQPRSVTERFLSFPLFGSQNFAWRRVSLFPFRVPLGTFCTRPLR